MIAFQQAPHHSQEMDIQKLEIFHFSWLTDPEHTAINFSAL